MQQFLKDLLKFPRDILTLQIIRDILQETDGKDTWYSLGRLMAIVQFYFMMINPLSISTNQLILFFINMGYVAKDKILDSLSTLKSDKTGE